MRHFIPVIRIIASSGLAKWSRFKRAPVLVFSMTILRGIGCEHVYQHRGLRHVQPRGRHYQHRGRPLQVDTSLTLG
jgi:hypothetical protein